MVLFEVKLLSTGHGDSLRTTMDLIKNRLDEAYLFGVGSLEPNVSSIELTQLSLNGKFYILWHFLNHLLN